MKIRNAEAQARGHPGMMLTRENLSPMRILLAKHLSTNMYKEPCDFQSRQHVDYRPPSFSCYNLKHEEGDE